MPARPVGPVRPPAKVVPAPEPTPAAPPKPDPSEKTQAALDQQQEAIDAAAAKAEQAISLVNTVKVQVESRPPCPDPPDVSGFVTKEDLAALKQELVVLIQEINVQPVPTKREHVVIVADVQAEYWPGLNEEILRAQQIYAGIRLAPPSAKTTGKMPKLVRYVDGTPVQVIEGVRDVREVLAELRRGNELPAVGNAT